MPADRKAAIPRRLEEMESAGNSHLLESSLRTLSNSNDPSSDTVTVPVDLLLNRFKHLDRGLSSLRKRLQRHEEALRRRSIVELLGAVVLVVAASIVTVGLSKGFDLVPVTGKTHTAQRQAGP